eukprot:Skav235555  [mRNA]  locus=scaffold3067:293167:294360:- [translate_table: standard]
MPARCSWNSALCLRGLREEAIRILLDVIRSTRSRDRKVDYDPCLSLSVRELAAGHDQACEYWGTKTGELEPLHSGEQLHVQHTGLELLVG